MERTITRNRLFVLSPQASSPAPSADAEAGYPLLHGSPKLSTYSGPEFVTAESARCIQCSSERIPWYPKNARLYSRRELAVDAFVHLTGVVLTCAAMVYVALEIHALPTETSPLLDGSMAVYMSSLLLMFTFSSLYNVGLGRWGQHHFTTLAALDNAGICLLIAGSYTPQMAVACCLKTLVFVWSLAIFTIATKCCGGRLNNLALHVTLFLAMGWSVVFVWQYVQAVWSAESVERLLTGGVLYTVGLVPWGYAKLEYHVCIWHVFVIAGSAYIFWAVVTDLEFLPHRVHECVATLQ